MKKLLSTDYAISLLGKTYSKFNMAIWLANNGWRIATLNIYNDGKCAEVTLSHDDFDKCVDVSLKCEPSTEHFVRSVFNKEIAEKVISKSKTTWVFCTPDNDKEAA